MKLLPFTKMHGAGNDFVVLDALTYSFPSDLDFSALAQKICARHFGVGSDGLLLLQSPSISKAAARMRMWNPDGTEDMCGNGLRCISRLYQYRHRRNKSTFMMETLSGLHQVTTRQDGNLQIEMGKAHWHLRDIPISPQKSTFSEFAVEYDLPLQDISIPHATSLSTGTTHTVIFVDELPKDEFFFAHSPEIENHIWFPERTSLLWTKMESDGAAHVRIWERGADETLACGTGACAVAAAIWRTKRSDAKEIAVRSKGGILRVTQDENGKLLLSGEAKIVFDGNFYL